MTDRQLDDLWRQITRTARDNARVIFRTAAEPSLLPGRLDADLLGRWRYEADQSKELTSRDRSAIYGGFHLLCPGAQPVTTTALVHPMDRMYRHQRHIYDLTRKWYLLGRDQMLASLAPRPGDRILEVGLRHRPQPRGRGGTLSAGTAPRHRCVRRDAGVGAAGGDPRRFRTADRPRARRRHTALDVCVRRAGL